MKVNVEIDLDEIISDIDAEDLLEAFDDDDAMLKQMVERLDVSDFLNVLDADEVAANLDYDGLSTLSLQDVAERIADRLNADEAVDFCRRLLKQACDNDSTAEERLAEIAKNITE